MVAQSWAPIRSTIGVSSLVRFGDSPAHIDAGIIELIKPHAFKIKFAPERLFNQGDHLKLVEGLFAGMNAIFEMRDSESMAMVLIELMGKLTRLKLNPSELKKNED